MTLIHMWAGLKLNTTLYDLEYTTFGAFYDLQVIKALIDELEKNRSIEEEIRPIIQKNVSTSESKTNLSLEGY